MKIKNYDPVAKYKTYLPLKAEFLAEVCLVMSFRFYCFFFDDFFFKRNKLFLFKTKYGQAKSALIFNL